MSNRPHNALFAPLATALCLAVASSTAAQANPNQSAQPAESSPKRAYSRHYNGAFHEYSLRGTWGHSADLAGIGVDAGARVSLPMLLADTRLSYRFESLNESGADLQRHGPAVHVALHPLYFALLGSDWLGYAIASVSLELGLGLHISHLSEGDSTSEDLGLLTSVGVGLDLPLVDPDRGYAPWVNLGWRMEFSDFDRPDGTSFSTRRGHIFVGLGWRINGLPL